MDLLLPRAPPAAATGLPIPQNNEAPGACVRAGRRKRGRLCGSCGRHRSAFLRLDYHMLVSDFGYVWIHGCAVQFLVAAAVSCPRSMTALIDARPSPHASPFLHLPASPSHVPAGDGS